MGKAATRDEGELFWWAGVSGLTVGKTENCNGGEFAHGHRDA